MLQVPIWCPLCELDLRDELRLKLWHRLLEAGSCGVRVWQVMSRRQGLGVGAIAAGGCWCWLFSARVLHWLLGVVPVAAFGQSLRAGGQAELMVDQAHE